MASTDISLDHVAMADIDFAVEEAESQLAKSESALISLIAKRDAQRQKLDNLLQQRERETHAVQQACEAAGVSSSTDLSRETAKGIQDGTWSGAFDWDERVAALLKSPFGCDKFRPFQREVINATLAGRDCFVVMRTGGGKSLTYQLPALLQGGISLIVSPLLSLISDQVRAMNLRSPGSAAALTSVTGRSEAAAIYRAFKGVCDSSSSSSSSNSSSNSSNDAGRTCKDFGSLRLVYVTPERVSKSKQLMAAMEAADKRRALTRFVVDEAHCCSQWGHDFRSDYGQLHILKKVFPRVPLLALTATAPAALAADVQRILLLDHESCVVMRAPSDRPNIFYEVLQKPQSDADTLAALYDWLKTHRFLGNCNGRMNSARDGRSVAHETPASGIIYCYSRKDADSLAASLLSLGVTAGAYHAGQEDSEKERVHSKWLSGSISIVCATVAFGLGIDKPNVRFVIHVCLPKSTEAYYQESGRAGRDGLPARVALFFSPADAIKMAALCHCDRSGVAPLRTMQRFAMASYNSLGQSACRRKFLARELGDCQEDLDLVECRSGCDVCSKAAERSYSGPSSQAIDATAAALVVLAALQAAASKSKKITFKGLVDDAVKLGKRKVKECKKTKDGTDLTAVTDASKCELLCATLFLDNVLVEDYHYTAYSTIVYCAPGRNASILNAGARRVNLSLPETLLCADSQTSSSLSFESDKTASRSKKAEEGAGTFLEPSTCNEVILVNSDSDDKKHETYAASNDFAAMRDSFDDDEYTRGDSDDDFESPAPKLARAS